MYAEIRRRLGLLRRNYESNRPGPKDRFCYSAPIELGDHFIILARGGQYGGEIGRVVAEPFTQTDSCYVVDILVSPEFRNRGIAAMLLKLALRHSSCSTQVPIDIEEDAIEFWTHLTRKRQLKIRLGLTQYEVMAIRSAMRPSNHWKANDPKD
ncbi:GNAT family N-acetyltransferase [Burkholderia sp. MSMB0856]|uniref:GNAT family N-acetyltransferase n=1 Tax=Burkholderia sp. MSMB0856 TaxID=1637869 RepID=UPI00131F3255|nr:GNAT family N-acetyltransferase [Burkholderia sp. MSMB0856]